MQFAIILFLVPFLVYIITSPHTVTMEDSASFLITANFAGVAHPPGYPLYTLLGYLFSHIPYFEKAFSIHLLNCTLGSLASYGLFIICYRLTKNQLVSMVAGISLSFSSSFWFQSITTEVYILHTFLFLFLLFLSLEIYENFQIKKWYLFCFVYGLSLSNHWPLLILSSSGFIPLFWRHRLLLFKTSIQSVGFVCLGLLPYVHLYLSVYYSDFFFYGKLDTLEKVFYHIIRREQWEMDSLQSAGILHSIHFLTDFFIQLCKENLFLIPVPIVLGVVTYFKKDTRNIGVSLVLFLLSSPILLLFNFKTEYNEFTAELFRYWQLAPYSVGIIFFAIGLNRIFQYFDGRLSKLFLYIPSICIPILIIFGNWKDNNLRKDTFAQDYSQVILDSLPNNSILFTNTDTESSGQIGYIHFVEGYRKDITIVSQPSALFPERYFDRQVVRDLKKKQILFLEYVSKQLDSGKRVFTTNKITIFNETYKFPFYYKEYGLFLEILLEPEQTGTIQGAVEKAKVFLTKYEKGEYGNHWLYYRNFAVQRICHFMFLNQGDDHPIFEKNRWCKLVKAQSLSAYQKNFKDADRLFSEIVKEPMQDIYIFERMVVYQQYLINKVSYVNTLAIDKSEKQNRIRDAVVDLFPYLKELEFCNNPLARTIKELNRQIDIPIDTVYLNTQFRNCR